MYSEQFINNTNFPAGNQGQKDSVREGSSSERRKKHSGGRRWHQALTTTRNQMLHCRLRWHHVLSGAAGQKAQKVHHLPPSAGC